MVDRAHPVSSWSAEHPLLVDRGHADQISLIILCTSSIQNFLKIESGTLLRLDLLASWGYQCCVVQTLLQKIGHICAHQCSTDHAANMFAEKGNVTVIYP
jgi:hypothetical protein